MGKEQPSAASQVTVAIQNGLEKHPLQNGGTQQHSISNGGSKSSSLPLGGAKLWPFRQQRFFSTAISDTDFGVFRDRLAAMLLTEYKQLPHGKHHSRPMQRRACPLLITGIDATVLFQKYMHAHGDAHDSQFQQAWVFEKVILDLANDILQTQVKEIEGEEGEDPSFERLVIASRKLLNWEDVPDDSRSGKTHPAHVLPYHSSRSHNAPPIALTESL